jgi:hypothetical protein
MLEPLGFEVLLIFIEANVLPHVLHVGPLSVCSSASIKRQSSNALSTWMLCNALLLLGSASA